MALPNKDLSIKDAVEAVKENPVKDTAKKPKFEVLPAYKPAGYSNFSDEMCIVLHGYGRVDANSVHYIDEYKFVGGVGRNIPKQVAECWKKGIKNDGKPAVSRVFPQAILPSDATEVDFATATGISPMPPSQLAAMINATDARALVEAMGRQAAVALAEELLKGSSH
jgi:hypothetical protein